MPHIEDLLLWAVAQEGKPYIFGAEAAAADPDPPAFDCSELIQWAAARVGVDVPDGAYWQYKTCEKAGTLIPVDQALATRGALLFRVTKTPPRSFDDVPHVALSAAGDPPMTVEARGHAWGVGSWGSPGRFQAAGLLPGFDYTPRAPLPAARPEPPAGLVEANWFYKHRIGDDPADQTFHYGDPGDIPIVGDWDGDGVDGIGVVRGTAWYLRNELSSGIADLVFTYGELGDIPIVGDWDGDGVDGIGVVRGGDHFYLRNTLAAGVAEADFAFGNPGDRPVVGKWASGQGVDGVGVHRGGRLYLRDADQGTAGLEFGFGDPRDQIVMGDWDGDGVDTPAAFRAGRWYVSNSNDDGVASVEFGFGNPTDIPLAGRWARGADRDGVLVAR